MNEPPSAEPILVIARRLTDYADCGQLPSPGDVVEACIFCRQLLAMSPEAAKRLELARARNVVIAHAICMPCMLKEVKTCSRVEPTKKGEEQLARSDMARLIMAELERRAKKE